MKLEISEFLVYLLRKRGFYGRLATSLSRVARPGLGALAVGVRKGRISLFYDPAYVAAVGMDAAMYLIEHELLHLALDHVPRYVELLGRFAGDDRVKAEFVMGIAADLAVNSLMRNHPQRGAAIAFQRKWILDHLEPGETLDASDGMHTPERYGLPNDLTFERYMAELMPRVDIVDIPFSDHSLWSGDDESDNPGGQDGKLTESRIGLAHHLRDQIKPLLRQALASGAAGSGRGLLPGSVEEFLMQYLAPPVVPWWAVFTSRAKASKLAKSRRTTSVPNRALMALSELDDSIIASPGRAKDRSWKVLFARDTSGSVPSEEARIAINELHHMLRVDEAMEVRSIDFDAAVQRDIVLKPGDKIPTNIMGRGGTDFDAPFAHIKQYYGDETTEPDIIIVHTDGYAPPVSEENWPPQHIPVIWLVTPQHASAFGGLGEVIVCDPKQRDLYGEPEIFTDN
jgi:predicted metal-dependent peptidase